MALRPITQPATAYRDGEEVVHTVDDLVAALGAASLDVTRVGDVVVVRRGEAMIRVVARDKQRVTLASLDIYETKAETLGFELALALVPIFGAMIATEAAWGAFVVDGSRDHEALAEERRTRIKQFAARLQANTAAKLAAYADLRGRS